jgi:hypothetical protein
MVTVVILVVVGLTSVAAYAVGRRVLGCSRDGLRPALGRAAEGVGLTVAFLALNLAIGFALVRALPLATGHFVSVYVLEDATLLWLSAGQGVAFRWWLDSPRA